MKFRLHPFGEVVIRMLSNVTQNVIKPIIQSVVIPGTITYTDEYGIYARLNAWGYIHKSVNHGAKEYARDDDGDGLCEVHVNTMEGFWFIAAFLVKTASWYFSRKITLVFRLF